jgi:hypothetical protein
VRELGYRWGLVVVILGLPVFWKGISTGEPIVLAVGSTLSFCGLVVWGYLRSRRKMSRPEHQNG